MRIQIVSRYLTLAEEGLVSKVVCPLDQGLLMPNQTIDDKIYLYCLSCGYKKEIGLELYGKMEQAIGRN